MSVDRILQLKLIADVSEINAKMPAAAAEVGRIESALGSLKTWGVAFGASLGADLVGSVTAEFGQAVAAAGELRRELGTLKSLTGSLDIDTSSAEQALADLTAAGADLGFGDPEKTARAFTTALAVTEDVASAAALVQAGWDLARKSGEDAETAFETAMDSIVGGGDEAEEKLGVFGETFDERMAAFQAKYGNFAEDFALTDEGQWQSVEATFDTHMTNLGTIVDDTLLEIKRGISDGIEDWQFILGEGMGILGKAWDQAWSSVGNAVKGAINTVLGAWNALDISIDFDFDGPGIPNPLGGWFVEPIRFSIHTGDLIPDVPLLAEGGIITDPTLALIGEGAHDEAVIPLDGRPLGNTYHISVSAPASSPADVGRAVVEAIEAWERRAGSGWRR